MSTTKQRKELRQRIIEFMPKILELLDFRNRVFDDEANDDADLRPTIIWIIKEIAELEMMSPSVARRALNAVEQSVERLKANLNKLPPSIQRLVTVQGLDEARKQIGNETEKTNTARKRRTAELTATMIFNWGGKYPTLAKGGSYIELAGLMYFVATGKEGNLESYCSQHFADLKGQDDGIDMYTGRRGPLRRSELSDDDKKFHEKVHQQRADAMKLWPPLEEVVDDSLARPLEWNGEKDRAE